MQQSERALSGEITFEKNIVTTGKSIILFSSLEEYNVYLSLFNECKRGLDSFDINIRGEFFSVTWDYEQGPISGEPFSSYSDDSPTHVRNVTLKFITV
ncbi:MAG: hypothetical protein HRU18_09005 [Pseudoalteromonas sp.]|uniref:hypothetical protein n=1 Tax=Pseudoalteromonas sp. TaxID=53249 RepID=UPI001D55F0FE|nr:hypothetical protein [Pseudoalteromonas sp.]NRA78336.1 hypothetical protein [Pseudoalteromonas sp.]